jgi:ABC-type microcin C transport system permease subunit YejE
MSKEPWYDVFRKSITRDVDGAFPAFFDFSDCIIEYVILDDNFMIFYPDWFKQTLNAHFWADNFNGVTVE